MHAVTIIFLFPNLYCTILYGFMLYIIYLLKDKGPKPLTCHKSEILI